MDSFDTYLSISFTCASSHRYWGNRMIDSVPLQLPPKILLNSGTENTVKQNKDAIATNA